jgi:hypothetical protein
MSERKDGGSTASKSKPNTLTADQVAVKQLVTITPSPRTAAELAAQYAGLRQANLWPEQSESSVKQRITELVERGVLKHGAKAADDEPTIELAEKQ